MYEPLSKNIKTQFAFTIIEILVALSIMAILFMVGVANFRGSQRSRSIDAIKNQIVSDLRQAQQYAQGANRTGCADGDDLEHVSLTLIPNTSYKITALCGSATVNLSETSTVPPNYTLEFKTAASDASVTEISFLPVGRGVVQAVNVIIMDSSSGEKDVISVNGAGEIR